MPDPRAVPNLLMPHPRNWQGAQMPRSCPGGMGAAGIDWCISSASNICLDDRTSDSVHLTETDEDKLFIEQEGESQMIEVRSRKLTEKGRYYQTEVKVKTFKSKKSTFSGTLRKTLLLRG